MLFRCISILTLTTLLVTVSQGTATNSSSYTTCYFNNPSSQCPLGKACTIVPPEPEHAVRRRNSYPEQDKQPSTETSFTLIETRRRRGSRGSRGRYSRGGRSSSRYSRGGRSSSRGTASGGRYSRGGRSSSRGTGGYGSRPIWRQGTRKPQRSYGTTAIGVTSAFVGLGSWYWWSRPSNYYRWRESNMNVNNLKKNQGICIDKSNLRTMSMQDCYNWCMSQKYNDKKCYRGCWGENAKTSTWDKVKYYLLIALFPLLCLCILSGYYFYKKRLTRGL